MYSYRHTTIEKDETLVIALIPLLNARLVLYKTYLKLEIDKKSNEKYYQMHACYFNFLHTLP